MTTHLFLFQIGPVQTFIAQARRTQDLFIGSYILSELASAGVTAASTLTHFKAIFPLVENGQVHGGAPHRFAFLCDEHPQIAAGVVQSAVQTRWLVGFADPVFRLLQHAVGSGEWQATFERQKTSWQEFYWAAVEYDPRDHGGSFRRVSAALAQRKYARTIHAVDEPGYKCTLTGAQSALELSWRQLRKHLGDTEGKILRPNERLGSLALIKRLAAISLKREDSGILDFEGFPSTREIAADRKGIHESAAVGKEAAGYIAVLHMDGDRMGQRLGMLQSADDHRRFSRTLADYASSQAQKIVQRHGGQLGRLVYSGGDDVLALLPLKHALRCADELRKRFHEITGCNASAGIAVTPAVLPLDMALELARDAEEMAKEAYGRNAIVVIEAHGTGQMRPAGAKWDIVEFILKLQALFEQRVISSKVGYDLRMLDHDLIGTELTAAREAEIKRLMKRRTAENATPNQVNAVSDLVETMINLVETQRAVPTWSDMANWAILARFLAQGGRREAEAQS